MRRTARVVRVARTCKPRMIVVTTQSCAVNFVRQKLRLRRELIKSPVCHQPICGSFGSESLNRWPVSDEKENQDHRGGYFPMRRLISMRPAESCSPKEEEPRQCRTESIQKSQGAAFDDHSSAVAQRDDRVVGERYIEATVGEIWFSAAVPHRMLGDQHQFDLVRSVLACLPARCPSETYI